MAPRKVSVWWDGEGDFLEVTFDDGIGKMKATDNPRVRVKIDDDGNVVGFYITSVSKAAKQKPFEVDLVPKRASNANRS
jgi:hypothetical protein